MSTPEDARRRATAAYDAASDSYDHPANSFWSRFGARTVERLSLAPGAHVLDVCCGSGASAIPAAEAVGPRGRVLGVDLAANLLALARAKAAARKLRNVEFRTGDMLALGLDDASFDAVVCVFGISSCPTCPAVRCGASCVRAAGSHDPGPASVRARQPVSAPRAAPARARGFNPWDRITEPAAVRALLAEGGVQDGAEVEVVAESATHPIASSYDAWKIVLGSGYRGTVEQLSPADRAHVQEACAAFVRSERVRQVETNVVFAVARKE
jgi:SAM-dependent methyltransferase